MYSEEDLQSAVQAGAITAEAAEALRGHVASLRATMPVDEEHFRLITGFNDIFVSVACLLVIFSAAATGSSIAAGLGGLLVAVVAWPMAEMFTRKRRMALPSIILLIAFALGLAFAAGGFVGQELPAHPVTHRDAWNGQTYTWTTMARYPWENALIALAAAIAGGLGAIAHWLRFRVAITIAAGTGAVVLLLLSIVAAITNRELGDNPFLAPAALICGLAVFAFAMRWDLADPVRKTIKADIAFWLHLLAAPLIAHPLFYWMGVLGREPITVATGIGVLAIYGLFAIIALAIDRRALLVSALAYVLVALGQLFRASGAVELNFALTALVIGSALLLLSAFWGPIRRRIVTLLPESLQGALPPVS